MAEERTRVDVESESFKTLKAKVWEAAESGSVQTLQEVIYGCKVKNGERQELINSVNDAGGTLLHTAAQHGQPSIISWLLSDGENGGRAAGFNKVLTQAVPFNSTALAIAAQHGQLEAFVAIVEGCQVERRERERMLNILNVYNRTVLHVAAENNQASIIKWILAEDGGGRAAGFERIFQRDTLRGHTALHVAAERGHLEAFIAIVQGCIADTGERDEMLNGGSLDQSTALHVAACWNWPEIITWLLSVEGGRGFGFNKVVVKTVEGYTALHIAARNSNLEACIAIVKGCTEDERLEIMHAVDEMGMNLLHLACSYGRVPIISWFLSAGDEGGRAAGFRDVLARNSYKKCTILHLAVYADSVEPMQALLTNCTSEERMELFLGLSEEGLTVLHFAVARGNHYIIAELLQHPECALIVNTKDNEGMTALHRAVIGGLNEQTRDKWQYNFYPRIPAIEALLGLDAAQSPALAAMDPNIGAGL